LNSRQRVLTALSHHEADRIPIDFGGTGLTSICYRAHDALRGSLGLTPDPIQPEDMGAGAAWGTVSPRFDLCERLHSDVVALELGKPDGWDLNIEYGERYDSYLDEWGIRYFRPKDGHYFDFREFPIQEASVEAIQAYQSWPDVTDPGRWRNLRTRALELTKTGKAITSYSILGGGIFEQAARLMPVEEFFCGIASDAAFSDAILGQLHDLYLDATEKLLSEVGDLIDVWVYWDDLSIQNGPMVNPRWYRRHLKPLHASLFAKVKTLSGAKILYHSCGAMKSWLPDLIEVGVDIINPVQISADGMDPFILKREFGNDLVFWGGGCDSQQVLPFGSSRDVIAEVKKNIDALAPDGGFIFASIHNIQNGVPPENILAMYDTCYVYGVY
jgi:uroporphyrinogen decarboxylase